MAGWDSLGGALTSAPAICSWEQGRLDVFGRGTDDALWHRSFANRAWNDWESLGGGLTSPPAAVSWGPGRIDVFVRGTDDALWHRWFDGRWHGWETLGGLLNFGPAVASWGPRRLDVLVRGRDNALWQRTFDRGWKPWTSVGDPLTTVPLPALAAVSSKEGRIDIVAAGTHSFLTHKSWTGEWGHPRWLGLGESPITFDTSLAISSWRADSLDIFMRGGDRALVQIGATTEETTGIGFTEPQPKNHGGILTSGPAAVASHSGTRNDVVVRGTDNAFWHTSPASRSQL